MFPLDDTKDAGADKNWQTDDRHYHFQAPFMPPIYSQGSLLDVLKIQKFYYFFYK